MAHRPGTISSLVALATCVGITGWGMRAATNDTWHRSRQQMVDDVIIGAGITNPRVIESMRTTERHDFVPRHLRQYAYLDMALPIGDQQTISSPFIVAFMTECVDPQPEDRVLEVGTGSGYQAAILSPLVKHVYSIEIVEPLGRRAARTLRQLRLNNVTVRIGDGFQGWSEEAPFDKIIVTCSPEKVPQPLIDQLADDGRLVIPVGERYQQTMCLFRKSNGRLQREALRPTLFVPMTGQADAQRAVRPDPTRPSIVNGSFEESPNEHGFVPGWYYQRQSHREQDPQAPSGEHYMLFENQTPGHDSHLMQGLAVDGRNVQRLELSAWTKTSDVTHSNGPQDGPRVVITFYDPQRREIGAFWLGPWRGDHDWHKESRRIRVPPAAREAIVRIGLFGATGQAAYDDIRLTVLNK